MSYLTSSSLRKWICLTWSHGHHAWRVQSSPDPHALCYVRFIITSLL